MLARSSRENVARLHQALKMCIINDLTYMVGYLPTRSLEFGRLDCIATVEVVGFDEEGKWDRRGRTWLKSVFVKDNTLFLTHQPDGSYQDAIKEIPADEQNIKTLEDIHRAVLDYIAKRYDVEHLKD